MSTLFSRRPDAVAAVRNFLISVRDWQDDLLPRYGEVAAVYGRIARAIAPVLNSGTWGRALVKEPELAFVVLAGTGLPGSLNCEVLDPEDPGARAAWRMEMRRSAHTPGERELVDLAAAE